MTKDGFWRIISKCAELCDCCPVQIEGKTEGCMENCAESLKSLYERLERESNDKARTDYWENPKVL